METLRTGSEKERKPISVLHYDSDLGEVPGNDGDAWEA